MYGRGAIRAALHITTLTFSIASRISKEQHKTRPFSLSAFMFSQRHLGAGLLSFCLMLLTTRHRPDKRKMRVQVGSSVKVWQVRIKSNINRTNWNFLLSGRCFLYLPRPCFSDGRKFGTKVETKKWKNYGRIWSYREMVEPILHRISSSITWAWFQGSLF